MIEQFCPKTESNASPVLSVVVPFFNEQKVLPELHRRLSTVLGLLNVSSEIVYVDDGSSDHGFQLVSSFNESQCRIQCICLSRNFGKEAAMSAGLQFSQGQAVIILDADLQDPPELIPLMLAKWREGYDVVNMQRRRRDGESWLKRYSAAAFYRLMNAFSDMPIPENVGDFRLLSRRVVEHINQLPERSRYMKGIFAWPGFRQTTVQFDRHARHSGTTKWNYFKLIGLAMDGLSSFSIKPLRIASWLGGTIAVGALCYGGSIVVKTLVFGELVTGYPSLMVVQLALGGIQLLCLGLMGEYIGRIFIETKQRPVFLVDQAVQRPQAQVLPKISLIKEGKQA